MIVLFKLYGESNVEKHVSHVVLKASKELAQHFLLLNLCYYVQW